MFRGQKRLPRGKDGGIIERRDQASSGPKRYGLSKRGVRVLEQWPPYAWTTAERGGKEMEAALKKGKSSANMSRKKNGVLGERYHRVLGLVGGGGEGRKLKNKKEP